MKTLLLYLLFVVFLTSNISKWYVDLGPRLNYYVPVLLVWVVLALVYLSRRPIAVPKEIRTLITLNLAFFATMALSLPAVFLSDRADLLGTSLRGLIANGINVAGITVALLVAARLRAAERARVLDLYLLAIAGCAAYTVAQGLGAYLLGLDLDRIVSEALPFSSRELTSISEDRWGLSGRRFYRLAGLTGDANLNAATLLMALPIIYHHSVGRWKLPFTLLATSAVAIIAQSLSLTVTPLLFATLALLTLRYGGRSTLLTWTTLLAVVLIGLFTWSRLADAIMHIVAVRLSAGGTSSVHVRIAADALRLWLDHPFGVGLNGFAVYSPHFSAHNSYLQNLVELGPLGLLVSLGTVWYAMRVTLPRHRGFGFTALLTLGVLAVSSLGHDLLRRFELAFVAYLWVGFAVMEHEESIAGRPEPTSSVARDPGPRLARPA